MLKTMENNIKMIDEMTDPDQILPGAENIPTSENTKPRDLNFILLFLNSGGQNQAPPLLPQEKQYFNFQKNETLKIEKIVLSCFANSNRKNMGMADLPFWSGQENGSQLVQKISDELPRSLRRFNEANIELYDTSGLWEKSDAGSPISSQEFLSSIQSCRWYGPYNG